MQIVRNEWEREPSAREACFNQGDGGIDGRHPLSGGSHQTLVSHRAVDFAVRPAAIPSGSLSGRGSDVYLVAGKATGVGSIGGSVSLAADGGASAGGGVSFLSG